MEMMNGFGYISVLENLRKENASFVVASVVKAEGSTLAKPGFRVIVKDDRIIYGSLGGACPESVIIGEAKKVLLQSDPVTLRIHLENATDGIGAMLSKRENNEIYVETFCGGTLEVFLEPFKPPERLIIFGQGGKDDVEDELIALAKKLGFTVILVDHAPNVTNEPDMIIKDLDYDLRSLNIDSEDFIVLLTKGDRDIEILKDLSNSEPAYIGMMASRKRINRDFEELRKSGIKEDFLKSINAPIGLDINAVSPFEIAVSIAAEITVKRRGDTRKLKTLNTGQATVRDES